MKPAVIIFTLAIAFGYLIGWATDSRAVETSRHLEYLIKSGKTTPSHVYALAPGQQPDKKTWLAALHVSCEALSGGLRCR